MASARRGWRGLFISDLQLPFEVNGALAFCKAVQREFGISDTNVWNVGDEVDHYFGSRWLKDPNAWYTADQEIKATKDKMREWYKAFRFMKVCTSNHGMRWAKKAVEAEIPSQMIRAYQEILEAPKNWEWRDKWTIRARRRRIQVIHGVEYSGVTALRNVTLDAGDDCVIFGHLHTNAGTLHLRTPFKHVWAMNVGCLIDERAFAFNYAKEKRQKAQLGVGVVLDDGLTPIWVPFERFRG